jgi:hypothetical protein
MKLYKELAKTIALTALISGLLAFVAGVHYEQSNTKQLAKVAQSLVPTVHATTGSNQSK